jgi:hypothetical protein
VLEFCARPEVAIVHGDIKPGKQLRHALSRRLILAPLQRT